MFYKLDSVTIDKICEFCDDIIDMLYEHLEKDANYTYPFFMAFATGNNLQKTEYKIFSELPLNCNIQLKDDRITPIAEVYHEIGTSGKPCNVEYHYDEEFLSELNHRVFELRKFCISNAVPCFLAFVTGNDTEKTDYLFEMVSPVTLCLPLKNNYISKSLRYTMSPDIYPNARAEYGFTEDIYDIVKDGEREDLVQMENENQMEIEEPEGVPDIPIDIDISECEIALEPSKSAQDFIYKKGKIDDTNEEPMSDDTVDSDVIENNDAESVRENETESNTPESDVVSEEDKPKMSKKRGRKKNSENQIPEDVIESEKRESTKKRGRKKKAISEEVSQNDEKVNKESEKVIEEKITDASSDEKALNTYEKDIREAKTKEEKERAYIKYLGENDIFY